MNASENSKILFELFDGDTLKGRAEASMAQSHVEIPDIGSLNLRFHAEEKIAERPQGVEKNPFTNKNVTAGRGKKKTNHITSDNKILQMEFHRDISQSSIQQLNVGPLIDDYPN
jgi:hypothetical protein